MDTLTRYRELARRIVSEDARGQLNIAGLRLIPIVDLENDHYLVVLYGRDHTGRRVNNIILHLDIIDGKFWVQYDGTDQAVASRLVEAGVPKQHIVLGFRSPEMRQHTDYAVA